MTLLRNYYNIDGIISTDKYSLGLLRSFHNKFLKCDVRNKDRFNVESVHKQKIAIFYSSLKFTIRFEGLDENLGIS